MSLPDISDSQTPAGNSLFEEVREKFLQTLPDRERSLFSKCASAKDLLAEARNWKTIKNRFQGSYLMGNIKKFSDCLQPYFDAVGMIVSSNPEYAAIAWGVIRLALQVFLTRSNDIKLERCSDSLSWPAISRLSSESLPPLYVNCLSNFRDMMMS
jgi:hypothetical protein